MLSIEILAPVLTGFIAVIALYLALSQERSNKRRFLLLVSSLLGGVSVLLGVEIAYREKAIAESISQLKKDWIVIREANILGVQVELLSPHGLLDPGLFEIARGIDVTLPISLTDGEKSIDMARSANLSEIINIENIMGSGRIGRAVRRMVYTERDNEKK